MPVLCIGPVCIPLNLLLPFLLGIAHHYGWLTWIKREWVTFNWWRKQFSRQQDKPAAAGADPTAAAAVDSSGSAGAGAAGQQGRYVCEGGVCRLVPADDDAASTQQQQQPGSAAGGTAAAASTARQRKGLVGLKATDL